MSEEPKGVVYFDARSDPRNPGWVLEYVERDGEDEQLHQEILAASDPEAVVAARREAARFLRCRLRDIDIAVR